MPAITAAAERAADAYVRGESVVVPDEALRHELSWRPGGFMELGDGGAGVTVRVGDGPADIVIKHHADQAHHMAPASAAAAWTWMAELYAACTRRGKAPVLRRHRDIDYRRQWFKRYQRMRFHDDWKIKPIAPGVLGKEYLEAVRLMLRDIGTASWRALSRTARRAADVHIRGHRVFLRAGGPYLPFVADDPLFTPLNHDGADPAKLAPGRGDFVIAIGQAERPGSGDFGEPRMFRRASRGVAWCVGAYQHLPHELRRGEIVIDQQWPVGEAMVRVAGYKTRLAPAGGVAATAVYFMLLAETRALVEDHRAHSKRPIPDPPAAPRIVPRPPVDLKPKPREDDLIFATLLDHVRGADL